MPTPDPVGDPMPGDEPQPDYGPDVVDPPLTPQRFRDEPK
jgi:hypothetical protein